MLGAGGREREGGKGGARPASAAPAGGSNQRGRARRPSPSHLTSSRHPSPPPVRSWLRGGGSNPRPSHFSAPPRRSARPTPKTLVKTAAIISAHQHLPSPRDHADPV